MDISVCFLIVSSSNNPEYNFFRDIGKLYFKKASKEYNLKYYFVESRAQNSDIIIEDDMIYVNGEENMDTMATKTYKALKYINANYEYDFMIRTSLSSFWNIDIVFKMLNELPKNNIAMGITDSIFISGTGIILSRDICLKLCEVEFRGHPEDVIISAHLRQFIVLQNLPSYYTRFDFITDTDISIPEKIENILYFRVKTGNNRIEYDRKIFKDLAKQIYDIDYNL